MKLLGECLAVGVAGSLGAILRFLVGAACARCFGTGFPVGTLVINVTGSFFLGWFLAAFGERAPVSDTFRLAIAVGFVGAYTTFSTFAYETNSLVETGSQFKAVMNCVLSLVLGLLAVRLGIWTAGR